MFEISKKFKFDAAHMIKDHFGKCKNLHGHTYTLELFISSKQIDQDTGVLLDYYNVGEIVKPIIEHFDHSFIYNANDPIQCLIAKTCTENNLKTIPLEFQTTAEMLARYFTIEFYKSLSSTNVDLTNVKIRVVVKETENSSATYEI